MKTVYLAGPILNCTVGQARDWRSELVATLAAYGIRAIDPLRCEPPAVTGLYQGSYDDPKFGTMQAIASKNLFDVRHCDVVLAYMPKDLPLSMGTLVELSVGHAWGKATVLVTDDPKLLTHPLVARMADWTLSSLEDAVDLLSGVLGDY
jgi:nucleoside 2-deoxyribosyltransferase